jgi:hypothetical protein
MMEVEMLKKALLIFLTLALLVGVPVLVIASTRDDAPYTPEYDSAYTSGYDDILTVYDADVEVEEQTEEEPFLVIYGECGTVWIIQDEPPMCEVVTREELVRLGALYDELHYDNPNEERANEIWNEIRDTHDRIDFRRGNFPEPQEIKYCYIPVELHEGFTIDIFTSYVDFTTTITVYVDSDDTSFDLSDDTAPEHLVEFINDIMLPYEMIASALANQELHAENMMLSSRAPAFEAHSTCSCNRITQQITSSTLQGPTRDACVVRRETYNVRCAVSNGCGRTLGSGERFIFVTRHNFRLHITGPGQAVSICDNCGFRL